MQANVFFSLVNKGFITWDKNMKNFPCGTKPVSRAGKIGHLACSGSQSQREIRFFLPAYGASHIIIAVILTQGLYMILFSTAHLHRKFEYKNGCPANHSIPRQSSAIHHLHIHL